LKDTASLVEIFSSIQGEGIYIGKRQLFIRFASCNLKCGYCDTPVEDSSVKKCLVEWDSGSGEFDEIDNPLSAEKLVAIAEKFLLKKQFHHSMSLTGGEPLIYAPFIKKFLKLLKGAVPVYLETNGTLCDELASIIKYADIISMDIKLPETAGIAPQWNNHKKFLEIASEKEVFVKTVMKDCTNIDELVRAAKLVSEVDENIPFVIQPLTVEGGLEKGAEPSCLFSFYDYASSYLKDVRIIPQAHKMMGIL